MRHSVPSAGQPRTLRLEYQDFRISSDIVRQSLVDGAAGGPGHKVLERDVHTQERQCCISLAFWKLLPTLQSMKKIKAPYLHTSGVNTIHLPNKSARHLCGVSACMCQTLG